MDDSVAQLVRQAQRGDRNAFAELIRRYERTALSLALAITGHGEAAGDAVQDAFIRAWQRLPSLKEPDHFGPWLVEIIRNLAIDHRRRLRRTTHDPLEQADLLLAATTDPSAELGHQEMRQQIAQALQALDETSRSIVILRYYQGLPSKQIGQILDLSPAAVDMRLTRARETLRRLLASDCLSPTLIRYPLPGPHTDLAT